MKTDVRRYQNLEELNRDAAALICRRARHCVRQRGLFTFVLSGGKSPRKLYERLTRPPYDVELPWSHVHFFWGDERCVPPTNPASNYRMAARALLSKIAPPPGHVHRPPTEIPAPEAAATEWETGLRAFFRTDAESGTLPVFDLVLLGLGRDGHTASLFPGEPALEETERWVAAVTGTKGDPPVPRLTLTLAVINRARWVMFLVSGVGKAEVVRTILEHPEEAKDRYPAARVVPQGRLLWLLDGSFV